MFAQGKPLMAPRADGGWDVFSQVWLQGEESPYGTGGISLAADTLAAQFSEGAFSGEAGLYHALNRSGVTIKGLTPAGFCTIIRAALSKGGQRHV